MSDSLLTRQATTGVGTVPSTSENAEAATVVDPVTGEPADGSGDEVSESDVPSVSNVHFDGDEDDDEGENDA